MNDVKIMQIQHANSQKQLKIAEEIVQKTKEEYKKLHGEYIKLENYKNKCEKYIKYLQDENTNIQLKLNNLYEERQQQQTHNKYRNNRNTSNNYYQLKNKEEEGEEEEVENITESEITETKPNRAPPRKKVKKGISNFI